MVRTGVLQLAEKDSRQVILGFPFSQHPAGHVPLRALMPQRPSPIAVRVVRALPIAIGDGNQPRAIRCCFLRPALNLRWHLSRTAHAVNSDRFSGPPPNSMKGLVELSHDASHERTITEPILDEDAEAVPRQSGQRPPARVRPPHSAAPSPAPAFRAGPTSRRHAESMRRAVGAPSRLGFRGHAPMSPPGRSGDRADLLCPTRASHLRSWLECGSTTGGHPDRSLR